MKALCAVLSVLLLAGCMKTPKDLKAQQPAQHFAVSKGLPEVYRNMFTALKGCVGDYASGQLYAGTGTADMTYSVNNTAIIFVELEAEGESATLVKLYAKGSPELLVEWANGGKRCP